MTSKNIITIYCIFYIHYHIIIIVQYLRLQNSEPSYWAVVVWVLVMLNDSEKKYKGVIRKFK